jgi:hypothetical protein
MLEAKTRGNLTPPEGQLLQQSLTQLRLMFVQVSGQPPAEAQGQAPAAAAPAGTQAEGAAAGPGAGAGQPPGAPAEEPKVKFSKKY